MMKFDEAWKAMKVGDQVQVSDGTPPPSSNTDGLPYKRWRSHNFTGELEKKVNKSGHRYLRIKLPNEDTPDEVDYLSYDVAEFGPHTFTLVA